MTDIIKMECGLPTNMNDPRMEYALELAYRIDVEIDENDCGFLGVHFPAAFRLLVAVR